MKTPFTIEEFFQIFQNYNASLFPSQLVIILLGILSVMLIRSKKEFKNNFIAGFLSVLWLWVGIVYQISFFTSINNAAYIFGSLFIIQGIFFIIELIRGNLIFSFSNSRWEYIGYFFILFGLIIYPLISYFSGSSLSATISLGLPCPTTIFTFGFLMLTAKKLSKYLLIIPTLWALIGTGAAINFGVYQDYLMLISAIIANIYLIKRSKTLQKIS